MSSGVAAKRRSAAEYIDVEGASDVPEVSFGKIVGITLFNFAYGCICTTMGMFILPEEALRLFPDGESVALGCFLLSIGLSQLVCPYVGLISDRCASSWGKRRPFIVCGALGAFVSVAIMQHASIERSRWQYSISLFVAMISLNVTYSAQCGLVPDIIPEAKQGSASGLVAVMQLLGSFFGFGYVMIYRTRDITQVYSLYQVLLIVAVGIVCYVANEQSAEVRSFPNCREVMKSYTIDTSQDMDFFWVFVSRGFFYAAVSCQAFMLYYIRDIVGTKNDATAREQVATIALIGQFTAASVAFPIGRMTDNPNGWSRKSMIYISCGVMSAVYTLFIIVPFIVDKDSIIGMVYVVAAIYGIGNGSYLAVDYALALDVLPSKSTSGQDLGVWGIAAFLGSSVGPMFWGAILNAVGRSNSDPNSYSLRGYACMLSFGCLACFLSGLCIKFVKGSR